MSTEGSGSAAKEFVSNVISFSYATIINALLGFFVIPLATRLFDPSEMGKINMFATAAGFFSMFAAMGLDQAYVRFYADTKDKRSLAKDCFQLSFFTWLFMGLSIYLFRNVISDLILGEYSSKVILFLLLDILIVMVLRYSALELRLKQEPFGYTVQSVLTTLFNNVLFVIAAFWIPTAVNAIFVKVTLLLLLALSYVLIFQRHFFSSLFYRSSGSDKKKLLLFGLPLLPATIFYWLNGSVAKVILTRYWGFEAVGILGVALTLSGIVGLIQTGFTTFWAPYSMKNYKTEQKRIQQVHHYIVVLLVLFSLALVLFQHFIFLLLGESYRSSQYIFPFLVISHVLYTISETTCIGIPISGHTIYQALVVMVTMVVNTALCFLLIPKYGLEGCALSIVTSDFVMVILRSYFGQKYYKSVDSFSRTIISLIVLLAVALLNMRANPIIVYSVCVISIIIESVMYRNELRRMFDIGMTLIAELLKKIVKKKM